ncbi:hypothetical protein LB503_003838 [Fusarium chuoi]|nr:hypothetical protein LB503_003838 [Fusarium chuoi]
MDFLKKVGEHVESVLNKKDDDDKHDSQSQSHSGQISLSLKDKASMEVKAMDNLKAMEIRATEVRDMVTKALLKAMGSPRDIASLRAMATRAMETQATETKVLLRAMGNLRVTGSLKATDSLKAMGSPKELVTKATTTRVTAIKAMVPKVHLKEVMIDHRAEVVHKGESNLTAMTPLMILLPNIFRGSRQ